MFTNEEVLTLAQLGATKRTSFHYQLSTPRGRCTGNLHKRRNGTFYIILGVPGASSRDGDYTDFSMAIVALKHKLSWAEKSGY